MMMFTFGSASRARVSSTLSEPGDRSQIEIAPRARRDLDLGPVDCHGISAKHDLPRIEHVARGSGEGTAMPHAAQAIHDLEHRPGTERLDRGERADDRIGVRLASLVGARDIGETAVRDVLEATGDAGGAMVLHVRNVDDLREAL